MIVLFIIVLLLIFLLWLMFLILVRKHWTLFSIGLFLFFSILVFLGLLYGVLPGSSVCKDLLQTNRLTGHFFLLGKPICFYESERSFTGDGYSIYIYNISDSVAKSLMNPDNNFYLKYPKQPVYLQKWQTYNWHKTPTKIANEKFIEFAMAENIRNLCLSKAKKLLLQYLQEPGNFYSYFYYMHDNYPGNIKLFVLALKERKIIIVSHDT